MKKLLLIIICSIMLISCNSNVITVKPTSDNKQYKVTIPSNKDVNITFAVYMLDNNKWMHKKYYGYDTSFGYEYVIKTNDDARKQLYLYDTNGVILDDLYEDMELNNTEKYKYSKVIYSNCNIEYNKEIPIIAFIYNDNDFSLSNEIVNNIDINNEFDYKTGRLITIKISKSIQS